ncbi:MAG: tRNA (cytidine(34)-2'-O)-methyltransferase [bacterium]|nr:tRNA (cytidine(34)-2'-O)-methyltransferase [bacterium]
MDIVLYEPEIPQNTGNIGRLCVCSGSRLHIVGKPGFSLDESAVKRAGLDYWHRLDLTLHKDWESFLDFADASIARQTGGVDDQAKRDSAVVLLYTRFAKHLYSAHPYAKGDFLVFGRETSGLPEEIRESIAKRKAEHLLRIPVSEECRSLNLSNTVALVLYEALRQQGFPGLVQEFAE